jgi:hypothetical protein
MKLSSENAFKRQYIKVEVATCSYKLLAGLLQASKVYKPNKAAAVGFVPHMTYKPCV